MNNFCVLFGTILIAAFGIVLIAGDVSHVVNQQPGMSM